MVCVLRLLRNVWLGVLTVSTLDTTAVAAPNKRVNAARKTSRVTVDGNLHEAVWQTARPAGQFWQRAPKEGGDIAQPTEFRVLFDEAAIYVGVQAYDDEPDKIRGMLTRRDEQSASDWVEVGIDSYHDKRTAFMFAVNPAGVQRDFLVFNDTEMDTSWDAVWRAAARVHERGWSAEFRIPLNQLRFSTKPGQAWGIQVVRTVGRSNEISVWSPWPRSGPQIVSHFGAVYGLDDLATPARLELLPYTVGGIGIAAIDDADPFRDDMSATGNIGLDFKYGIGNNITLSGTVNPDFGQVEADPSEVNLSDNESFFQERRPFFLEGTDIFKFRLGSGGGGSEQLFYTRRIGAAPHDTVDGLGEYYTEPSNTTIYSAAKLSGKTAGGWSFGVLDALTAEETGTFVDDAGERHRRVVEPLTNYSVLRLAKDMRDGRTNVNAALTAVHRRLGDSGLVMHEQAYSSGIELTHRFARDRWRLQTRLVGSHVRGSAASIDDTQRSYLRYFHRSDANHIDYDPTRTSLSGAGLMWSISKNAGGKWNYASGGDLRSPGLELNDLGFQRYADGLTQWVWGEYRDNEPGDKVMSFGVSGDVWMFGNNALSLLSSGGGFNAWATFKNFWTANIGFGSARQRTNTSALRGGPAMHGDPDVRLWMGGSTDSRKMVRANVNVDARMEPAAHSHSYTASGEIAIQARSDLDISIGTTFARNIDDDQYIDEALEDRSNTDQPDITHYILGRLEQTTLALTLRLNYTFTPRLTVQLYAQPFTSTGRYTRYKEVDAPKLADHDARFHVFAPLELLLIDGTYHVDRDRDGTREFTFSKADFNFRQLRSNLVIRWEYLPGSAIFLVWSHDRSGSDDNGMFFLDKELQGIADATGEHVVMVKANYWYAL